MPFYDTGSPSLALGLLKSILEKDGIPCDVLYPNLEFAVRVGVDRYERLVRRDRELFAGEWAFASVMWEDACPPWQDYAAFFKSHRQMHETDIECHEPLLLEDVEACRAMAAVFVEELATRIQWHKYSIVGFSSSFQQNLSSLALARSLKTKWPELCVVFGGANCEAEIGAGLFELAPFLDAVFVGEADLAFPAFVRAIDSDVEPTEVQNAYQRVWPGARNLVKTDDQCPATVDLEKLPYPDFSDYFHARRELPFPGGQGVYVPFETSRGCWWGQKQRCTFCGLNGKRMAFRAKSADRALRELRHLMRKHGDECTEFSAVDNIIPASYFDTLLPNLAGNDRRLFFETKANLTANHIEILREAGVTRIQPGIESLNTTALRRMKKGVTAIQNVALLKFCLEYGVYPNWNYLVGFPGETEDDYAGVCDLIRQIPHLTPPFSADVSHVKFQRFSPYCMRPRDFGISGLRPFDGYRFVFPTAGPESVRNLCYFFTGECARFAREDAPVAAVSDSLRWWAQAHEESALLEFDVADGMLLCDFRQGAVERLLRLPEKWANLYRMFREPRGLDAALAHAQRSGLSTRSMDECLDVLRHEQLLFIESGRALALTIRLGNGYAPSLRIAPRLARLVDGLEHVAGLSWNWNLRPFGLA
jgi:ribosomal peptide maturation radical SAM protein 1